MSTPIIFNSISYNVPAYGDTGYAQGAGNLSSYLIAIAAGTLQQSGGTFSLIADVNFGTGFGLLSKYFTSITANAATAGQFRLAHADTIDWRNNANSANLVLGVNSSDQLTYQGAVIPTGGASFVASITGTANEIIASSATGAVTLSTPQAIGTSSTPTFGGLTTNGVINSNGGILVSSSSGLSFSCTTSGTISFDAPAGPISSYALLLPTSVGGTGQVLTQTNSPAGQLGWATPAAGTVTSVSGTANQITSTGGATPVLAIANPLVTPGAITATGNISAGNNTLLAKTLTLGSSGNNASLFLTSTTAQSIDIIPPAGLGASYNLILPLVQGGTGTVLTNSDGAGTLTWTTPATGTVTSVSGTANQIASTGGATPVLSLAVPVPTVQKFVSGSGTYTRPSPTPAWVRVTMVGAGGGGAGGGTGSPTAGGTGGNTTFGSALLTANGGTGGVLSATGSAASGGSASLGSGPIGTALTGGTGLGVTSTAIAFDAGAAGGSSAFGGNGGGNANAAGGNGVTNTGGGGAGGGTGAAGSNPGGGGGAGGYISAIITAPASTYAYAVGVAGTAGAGGTGGFAGGTGGSGYIVVEEHYV